MEIAFCRWVCVDGVVLVPDRLGPQNPDCGTPSRFYRRGWRSGFETGAQRLDCPIARLGDAGSQ
jgi:hypothetical protein